MKSTILAIASLFTVIAFTPVISFAQAGEKLQVGDALPGKDVTMKNATGATTTMEHAMGANGILVMFSCNTCPFVVKNQPITTKTIALAAANKVGVVILNSNEAKRDGEDSYDAMKQYAQEQKYAVPYLIDQNSKLADLFGANHTPEVFLFDAKGRLVYKGAMNDNPSDPNGYKVMYIEDALKAVAAGKPATPNNTKSIGCSIKRKA